MQQREISTKENMVISLIYSEPNADAVLQIKYFGLITLNEKYLTRLKICFIGFEEERQR